MAFHVIRDEKGRMEKILDDKEYDSYQKRKGCFQFLLAAALIGLAVYGSTMQEPKDSSDAQTETVAVETQETVEMAETADVKVEDTNGMKEEDAAFEEDLEDVKTESEDTSSVIDEDELTQRFMENQ